MARQYKLICQGCGKEFDDNGFLLECDTKHEPALLMTRYAVRQFETSMYAHDIYRYQGWLPISHAIPDTRQPVTYQSKNLCRITGLPHLWIVFNGYEPQKGIKLGTATFKDFEAYTTLSRLPEKYDGVLVVASAGNTAAAFADACSRSQTQCLIILPANGLHRMQFTEPLDPCVKIVALTGLANYSDTIGLACQISKQAGFIWEGGVKNVGRRDGLSTTLLSAVEMIGHLPDYYFQAVGSASGAIAVHEAARRLLQDGRFGQHYPHLMLSQNLPFAPIYFSWKEKQQSLINFDRDQSKKQIQQMAAPVLSNQNPPYSVRGGVFDILSESQGDMLVADNDEVLQAMNIFRESEGIDIEPAAGVALATLLKEVTNECIDRDAFILLNITGGGWERRCSDYRLISAQPNLQISEYELALSETTEKIVGLFQ